MREPKNEVLRTMVPPLCSLSVNVLIVNVIIVGAGSLVLLICR